MKYRIPCDALTLIGESSRACRHGQPGSHGYPKDDKLSLPSTVDEILTCGIRIFEVISVARQDNSSFEVTVLSFLLLWVGASIVASLIADWLKLIPSSLSRRERILVHVLDTVLLTALLTLLLLFGIYPSWLVVLLLILFSLTLSVWVINRSVHGSTKPPETPTQK